MRKFYLAQVVLIGIFFLSVTPAPLYAQEPTSQIHDYTDMAAVNDFSSRLEERIKKYMFIVESMGFKLHELILDSESKGFATLIFQGKISISDDKFKQLIEKYTDETKLMTILKLIHERDRDTGYALSPQQIVITTTTPPGVKVHFK